jgi:UDP-N-acetylmuramoylalanine--D-glutamate ligase
MDISDLKNKLVAIVGFGQKEGRATAEYLLRHGITPVLFDQKPWDSWPENEQDYIRSLGVQFIFGSDYLKELKGFDVAFRNPSVPYLTPELQGQQHKGMVITSQTKWFFEHCPAIIIGVTGTKGKGTTASLISEMLKKQKFEFRNSNFEIYLTGNIGKIQPFEILDNLKPEDHIVFELSSFQLQDLKTSPHVGAVLMVTSEHLDHHATLEEYREAKSAITKYQKESDFAIYNSAYPASKKIGEQGSGKKMPFDPKDPSTECFVDSAKIYLKKNGSPVEIIEISKIGLRGEHNWENCCAAILAADACAVEPETMAQALSEFKGLEHRLEFVTEKNGITFYNDSFATTPESTIAAITSFSEPLILILGGSSKNSDFTKLVETLHQAKNIKNIIFIGPEGKRIKELLQQGDNEPNRHIEGATSMGDIFKQIKSVAAKGDVVLLSPACASFGMFKNYKDRGEQFKKTVLG